LITKDDATSAVATVIVSPAVTAMYKVVIIAYEFDEEYTAARYGLMFVHD